MEWFNDVWTKEVFAGFMGAKIVNPSFPDINHDLNFMLRHYPSAYSVDRSTGANPIRQLLPNLREAGQMYGAIIYNKAPIMMRQLDIGVSSAAACTSVRCDAVGLSRRLARPGGKLRFEPVAWTQMPRSLRL